LGDIDGDDPTRARHEADELLEGESSESAVAEVGHPRLIRPQDLGGVLLRPAVHHLDDLAR